MSAPPMPLLIATLPGRTPPEVRRELEIARSTRADVAEVRFDRWASEDRPRATELFPSPLPLLATLRSRAEGGDGPSDPESRGQWRDSVRALPFEWVDLETSRDLTGGSAPSPPPRGGWILSSHLPPDAPAEAVSRGLRASADPKSINKVVVPAGLERALSVLLPQLPAVGEVRAVLHTTGASGGLLRAWGRRLGMAAVYASLPERQGSTSAVEPSQVPVDRMRWLWDGAPEAPLFALVGRPVSHSRSPALHCDWMRRLGDRGLYIALECASDEEFSAILGPLADGGFRGVNVTHPFKDLASRLSTSLGKGAEVCGCANTLTLHGSEVEGENTDLLAILRRLEELRREGRWDGRRLTVLGTGGAARATLAAGRELGAETELLGRRPEAVRSLARAFEASVATSPGPSAGRIVVNATTVGRGSHAALEVDLNGRLGLGATLLDWVYRPDVPTMAQLAVASGARYEDGLRLLAYAAAASYEVWWDHGPSPEQVEAALSEAA